MTSSSMIKGGGGKDLVKFGDIYVFTNMSPVATNFLDLQVREFLCTWRLFGMTMIQNDTYLELQIFRMTFYYLWTAPYIIVMLCYVAGL